MIITNTIEQIIDIIKQPIITEKIIKNNIYSFNVIRTSNKNEIKKIIEYIFDVQIQTINIINSPCKKKTKKKVKRKILKCKKVMITLMQNYKINLF
uniref:50S ribosomal protein L23 n=1 Tax=Choreocolax polysiphoniae TaxID=282351 RepID=A0A0B5W5J5_9FLOR|nr:50S ribosomal protein L23 [Choreocolax polysiphoniae]AJH65866.1 50S ribosomal protein L23 [Choreocolax polysiphoniae]